MNVSMTIEALTMEQFLAEVRRLASSLGFIPASSPTVSSGTVTLTPENVPPTSTTEAPLQGEIVPPIKRRAPKKAVEPDPTVIDIGTDGEKVADAPAAKQPDIEEIRKALKSLSDKKGTDAVFAVLKSIGVEGASPALKAGKGAEVIEKATAALNDASIPDIEPKS